MSARVQQQSRWLSVEDWATLLLLGSLVFCTCFSGSLGGAIESADSELEEGIRAMDPCAMKSIFSFTMKESLLPTGEAALNDSCRRHSEGYRCIKESKVKLPVIAKRSLLTMVHHMQRFTKKICKPSATSAEERRRFLAASQCIMEKRWAAYKELELGLEFTLNEIIRRNYNDSAPELNVLCCSLVKFRKDYTDSAVPGCPSSQWLMRELMKITVSEELSLICDDEEKLVSTVCSKLEPLQMPKSYQSSNRSLASSVLYLVATLGEPDLRIPVNALSV